MSNQWNFNVILQNLHQKLNRKVFKFKENKNSKNSILFYFRNLGELT